MSIMICFWMVAPKDGPNGLACFDSIYSSKFYRFQVLSIVEDQRTNLESSNLGDDYDLYFMLCLVLVL